MAIAVHPRGGNVLPSIKKMTRREQREQKDRVKRFLALPPQLQEGAARYAENIQKSYTGERI